MSKNGQQRIFHISADGVREVLADLPPLPPELPQDFAVGVIYGPSQSGKSSTLKRLLDFYRHFFELDLKPRTSAEFRDDEAVISHPDLGETPDQAILDQGSLCSLSKHFPNLNRIVVDGIDVDSPDPGLICK